MSEAAEVDLLQGRHENMWTLSRHFSVFTGNKRCSDWRLVRRIFIVFVFILAIKESLQKDGTLGRFKGEIRAAVTNVLNKNSETGEPPKIPDETRLINELIKEYLSWNGYLYTEQVLSAGNSWIYNRKNLLFTVIFCF